jgi:iron complex outermembrane receptor protein
MKITVPACVLYILFTVSSRAPAQDTGCINGSVTDRETGRPLAGANVIVAGTGIGTITDADGKFLLASVPSGTLEVRASYIGFAQAVEQAEIAAGETTRVVLSLLPGMLQIQPITVSATRGRERETPVTFSTLDRGEIRERQTTQDIPVLLSELPSTTVYSEAGNGIGYTYLNIRGFDARRIAVMINGIPQNDPEDHNVYWLDFPDIAASLEDIQVQRGAGSAFYGPAAIGGSVNLVTESFSRDRSLQVSAGTGAFNTRRYALSFTSGLFGDRYALHTRLSKILSSGYRERSWVDFNSFFAGVVRFDPDMTTQLNVYGGPVSDHLAYYGIPKSDVTDREKRRRNPILREEEVESFSQPHYELFHEWRVSPAVTLNTTLFLVFGDGYFDYDGSWAPYSYFRIGPQFGFPVAGDPDTLYFGSALIRATVSNRQYGWLPRVTWRHGGGELIAGAEVRVHRSLHWGRLQRADGIPLPGTAVPEDHRYYEYKGAKDIVSLYAHELVDLRSDLKLMLDLQYVYNRYRLFDEKFVGTDFSVPYHFVNPRLGLNYNLNAAWNAYVSIAYTSREPRLKNLYDAAEASTPAAWGGVVPQFGVTADGRFDFTRPLVRPEALVDVELGTGFTAAMGSLTANVYWMDFRNEIVRSGQIDRFGQPVTGNAERTRHIGIELSGRVTPLAGLECGGNVTVSRNRFVRHTDFTAGVPVRLDGNHIAGFPDVLANVRASFQWNGLLGSLSARYSGKQYTDNLANEQHTVDPACVVNGLISWTVAGAENGIGWEAKLQVNNMFDRLYAAYGEGTDFFVAAGRHAFFSLSLNL